MSIFCLFWILQYKGVSFFLHHTKFNYLRTIYKWFKCFSHNHIVPQWYKDIISPLSYLKILCRLVFRLYLFKIHKWKRPNLPFSVTYLYELALICWTAILQLIVSLVASCNTNVYTIVYASASNSINLFCTSAVIPWKPIKYHVYIYVKMLYPKTFLCN